jgi:sucrose-6-phosphate hydrolase SacC (GH32 family)
VRIAYDVEAQQLVFNRPDAGIRSFNPMFSAPLAPIDNRIRFRILVDRSSVEVFANDGLVTMTSQVFPDAEAGQVRLFATNGTARALSLRAYELKSIWREPGK